MRIKGGTRILKDIDTWRAMNRVLTEDYICSRGRNYCKIYVSPYSDLQLGNTPNPKPKGIIRSKILEGLVDIYKNWQITLDALETPYYLKLWLYEQRFEKSQVVCGIGPYLNFYDTTFVIALENASFPNHIFQNKQQELSSFTWQKAHDLEHIYASDYQDEDAYETFATFQKAQNWYDKHRKKAFQTFDNDTGSGYSLSYGNVWLGDIPPTV